MYKSNYITYICAISYTVSYSGSCVQGVCSGIPPFVICPFSFLFQCIKNSWGRQLLLSGTFGLALGKIPALCTKRDGQSIISKILVHRIVCKVGC